MSATCTHPDAEAYQHPECAGCRVLETAQDAEHVDESSVLTSDGRSVPAYMTGDGRWYERASDRPLRFDAALQAFRFADETPEERFSSRQRAAAWPTPPRIADDMFAMRRSFQEQLVSAMAMPAEMLDASSGSGSHALGQVEERQWQQRMGPRVRESHRETGLSRAVARMRCQRCLYDRMLLEDAARRQWRCESCYMVYDDDFDGGLRARVCAVCDVAIGSGEGWLHSVQRGVRHEQVLTCAREDCKVAAAKSRSLLDPNPDPAAQALERSAIQQTERPGSWFGDDGADGRMLTQDETDQLVRAELWQRRLAVARGPSPEEWTELNGILGYAEVCRSIPATVSGPLQPGWSTATQQRGGICSDPLVRLLAFRAWGDRDRRWFEERGVRKGEAVEVWSEQHRTIGALAWPSRSGHGLAADDARPGEVVELNYADLAVQFGPARISDRPRTPPADWRAPDRSGSLMQRLAQREIDRFEGNDLELDRNDDLVEAIAYGARAMLPPPQRRPTVMSSAVYEQLVLGEIRQSRARGDSRRRIIRYIASQSTLTRAQVVELVDRELSAVGAGGALLSHAELVELADARVAPPAPPRPSPPVPPWARERRRRSQRPGR